MAVERARLVVVLSAQLHPGHVAQADDSCRRIVRINRAGLDHDRSKLLRSREPAQRIDRQLERLDPGGGHLADLAGGRIDVLAADGAGHIHGGHAARRQLLRVEPGADAVVALAHVVDVRDAVDPQQLVLDVDRGEVAQVDVVIPIIGREEIDDHQDIGGLLADRDPLVLDLGRQLRHGERHAVLHHHQGRIDVGADIEGHGQRVRAVVAHLRGHVEHALDAVDLLLDHRRHRVGHDRGTRPGVVDGHRHPGRRDPGILRHRQPDQRDPADQGDDDGKNRREDRSIDEEF